MITTPREQVRAYTQEICDAIIESINEYASLMESGQIPWRSGPEALREYAQSINVMLILKNG